MGESYSRIFSILKQVSEKTCNHWRMTGVRLNNMAVLSGLAKFVAVSCSRRTESLTYSHFISPGPSFFEAFVACEVLDFLKI